MQKNNNFEEKNSKIFTILNQIITVGKKLKQNQIKEWRRKTVQGNELNPCLLKSMECCWHNEDVYLRKF